MTRPAIEKARELLAARYGHAYHKTAILRGDWDSGSLIAAELERIEADPALMINPPAESGV